jgi:hypothetical protein
MPWRGRYLGNGGGARARKFFARFCGPFRQAAGAASSRRSCTAAPAPCVDLEPPREDGTARRHAPPAGPERAVEGAEGDRVERPPAAVRSASSGGFAHALGKADQAYPGRQSAGPGPRRRRGRPPRSPRSAPPWRRPASAARRASGPRAELARRPAAPEFGQPRHRASSRSSVATVSPAAIRCPPPFTSSPSAASRWIAAPRSTPETERPEPLPSPLEPDHHGGAVRRLLQPRRDDAHHAGMPAFARGPDQAARRARAPRPAPARRRAPPPRSRAARC